MDQTRLYHLDALRAFAMLLGIVLHATLAVVPWFTVDWQWAEWDERLVLVMSSAIHGFRMPLFFLISGFFTAMLWQHHGYRGLIKHRLRRVGLPFVVFWPIMAVLFIASIVAGLALFYNVVEPEKTMPEWDDGEPLGLMHLWFLYYLILFVIAYVSVLRGCNFVDISESVWRRIRRSTIYVIPLLGVIPYLFMPRDGGAPEVDVNSFFNWRMFTYYFGFFVFGGLIFGQTGRSGTPLIQALGNRWYLLLPICPILWFVGMSVGESAKDQQTWFWASCFHVAYSWTACFGLIGIANRYLSTPRYWVRFWSDASFWMYLMHLPLVFLLQGIVGILPIPFLVQFVALCSIATGILFLTYKFGVRYTIIGTLLNGKRSKTDDAALQRELNLARVPE